MGWPYADSSVITPLVMQLAYGPEPGLSQMCSLDALDFDRKCDGSLPLEDMISYNPAVRKIFEDIDRSKARVWALTNAYKPVRDFGP